MLTSLLTGAAAGTAAVVRGVRPDHLDAPTPCRDWDVRALTNHLRQVITAARLAGSGAGVPGDLWTRTLDDVPFDADVHWDESLGTVRMGDTPVPAPMAAAMLAADLVLHGWDLARATGQAGEWPPDVVAATYEFVAGTAEQARGMGLFADPVPLPGDAPVLDRALALSGRDPSWSAVTA